MKKMEKGERESEGGGKSAGKTTIAINLTLEHCKKKRRDTRVMSK